MKTGIVQASKMTLLLAAFLILSSQVSTAQVVNESARKKFSIGVGMFTDIWSYNSTKENPANLDFRTINQGFQTFATYNTVFGKSNFGVSIGLGFRCQNAYGNFKLNTTNPAYTQMVVIPDSLNWQRAKLALPYIELPIELRFRSKSKVTVGVGFKVGYLMPAHYKYVGEDFLTNSGDKMRVKFREIKNLETFSYGPTFRIGYSWFNVAGYFSLSKLWQHNKGPDMYPVSIGFILVPF